MVEKCQIIEINRYNARYFEKLGYAIKRDKDNRGRDTILPQLLNVDINDIPKYSKIKIEIVCDYCGKKFYESVVNYHEGHKIVHKDCCCNCIKHKILDAKNEKYRSVNPVEISKINGTNIGRNKKYQWIDIIAKCELKNYTILSDILDNPRVKDRITLKCNLHNCEFEISIEQLMKDVDNCIECEITKKRLLVKSNITIVQDICDERDYTLLSSEIHNCDDKIEYICNKHKDYGIQTTSLWGLQHSKNNCSICKRKRGEEHHNWQGGKTLERDAIKHTVQYKNWVKSVFERDNYTCQHCGKTGKEVKLNAHHIENFSTNPDKRFDIDNGITFCEQCHLPAYKDSFHSLYGVYNNNLQQIIEFNNY